MTSNIESTEPKRGPGRPATLTLDKVEEIGTLIAKGMTEEQACLHLGVNHCTFRTARHRNEEFETAIKRAQAQYLAESLECIGAGRKGWQGRAWILERRHGDQFRRNTGMEVTGFLAMHVSVDVLIRKPLAQWTAKELDASVGGWKLLRAFSAEQLESLLNAYHLHWGAEQDRWSDEQLDWTLEIFRRCNDLRGVASDPLLLEALRPRDQARQALPLIADIPRTMGESPSDREAPIFALG